MAKSDGPSRVYVEREDRTFESRLQFIADIFGNKYKPYQIMASCIQHKLNKSYEAYIKEIHKSLWDLAGKNPIDILKKIDG